MPRLALLILVLTAAASAAAPNSGEAYFPCRSCHGDRAWGSPPIHAPALAGQSADYLARQLRHFRNGVRGAHPQDTWGRQMALMAANLDAAEISQLASAIADMPPWPAGPGPMDADGPTQRLFTTCAACHGASGQGSAQTGAPRIGGMDSTYLAIQLRNFRDGARGTADTDIPGQQMRSALPPGLDDDSIDKLARYIQAM